MPDRKDNEKTQRCQARLPGRLLFISFISSVLAAACSNQSPRIKANVDKSAIKSIKDLTAVECTKEGEFDCITTDKLRASHHGAMRAYPPCQSDGETDCVATQDFKALEVAKLVAANIRKDAVVGGITGSYPSQENPLEAAVNAPDLTSFGPTTPVGSYRFFDSAGGAYAASVADGGTIIASTTDQLLSKENTLYRAAVILGDANLVPDKILSGITIFGVSGANATNYHLCGHNGERGCLAATTEDFFAATVCAAGGSKCFIPAYTKTSQPLKAIDYDAISAGKAGIKSTLTIADITGTLTTCSANNQTGCVTSSSYLSADFSALTAANIKSGVTIAAVTGTYPSAGNRLASASAATDLTSFGPATAVGAYQFFDSTGAVHSANVAEISGMNPTKANQIVGSEGTLYRSITVLGDENLSPANIRADVSLFGTVGAFTTNPPACTDAAQQNCLVSNLFYSGKFCLGNDSACFVPSYSSGTAPLRALNYDVINAGKASLRTSLTIADITGTLADCSGNSQTNCVATSTYKSSDFVNLLASNIKNGVTIAGNVGTYPSAGNLLAANTSATDLTSFDQNTAIGDYEYFDSAGVKHTVTVADGGTITPGASTQTLSDASKVYRKAIVLGDANLTAANIKSGVNIFSVVGTAIPLPDDCGANGAQNCVAASGGSYYAATACSSVGGGSNCYLATYDGSTQKLKAINYDTINSLKGSYKTSLTLGGLAGTLPTCTASKQSVCVTTTTYQSANNLTSLTADNIRSGVTAAEVAGGYPSASYPLANNTGATDLTTFDATTAAGTYEFFDSAGTRYPAVVAVANGGVNVTPGTADQVFNPASGALFSTITVSGDADLVAGKIKSGVTIFTVNGTVVETPADCSSDGAQTCVARGAYYAATGCVALTNVSNCYIPTYATTVQPLKAIDYDNINLNKAAIRSSLTVGGVTGTLADCTSGTTSCYAADSSIKAATAANVVPEKILLSYTIGGVVGNITLPAASKVLTTESFGENSGTSGLLSLPAATNVLFGSGLYGDASARRTPSLTLPLPGKVLQGTIYGVGGTGYTGTLTLPLERNVVQGSGSYGEIGNLKIPSFVP